MAAAGLRGLARAREARDDIALFFRWARLNLGKMLARGSFKGPTSNTAWGEAVIGKKKMRWSVRVGKPICEAVRTNLFGAGCGPSVAVKGRTIRWDFFQFSSLLRRWGGRDWRLIRVGP